MDDHSMPGPYVLYSVELVKRWGVTAEQLLEGTGLDVRALADLQSRVPLSTVCAVLARARALTGEPAYGYYLGLQMRISAHGMLGVAALSAATMREAIEITIRFMPIVTTALSARLEIAGQEASLVFEEHADFGVARESLLVAAIIGVWHIGLTSMGRPMTGRAELALPEPENYAQVLLVGQGRLLFGQPAHRIVFDAAVLDAKLQMADPVVLQLARERCEKILASRGPSATLAERVRSLVILGRGRPLPIESVAQAMSSSVRTLKRQLASEGTTFSAIVDDDRREQALALLRSNASLKDIADRLGYANLANFSRAFQRWTGTTPSEHKAR
jgi:AraC-like DNA-binding protein